jgi:hypothetical protein
LETFFSIFIFAYWFHCQHQRLLDAYREQQQRQTSISTDKAVRKDTTSSSTQTEATVSPPSTTISTWTAADLSEIEQAEQIKQAAEQADTQAKEQAEQQTVEQQIQMQAENVSTPARLEVVETDLQDDSDARTDIWEEDGRIYQWTNLRASRQAFEQQEQAKGDTPATSPKLENIEMNLQNGSDAYTETWKEGDMIFRYTDLTRRADEQICRRPDMQTDLQPAEQADVQANVQTDEQVEEQTTWLKSILAENGYKEFLLAGLTPERAAEQAAERALERRQQEQQQADKQARWEAKWQMKWQQTDKTEQKDRQDNAEKVTAMRISARPAAPRATTPRPVETPRSGPNRVANRLQGSRFERSWMTFVCFFCEEKGHKKSRCPHMRRLLNAGEIHLDWKYRICLGPSGNGYRPVWKPQGMSMMQAVFRAADADEQQMQMQMQAKDVQMISTEVVELLEDVRANIQRFLEESKKPNRWKEPVRSLWDA